MDDLPISMTDLRQAGHCARGLRPWFRQHGLDDEFRAVVKGDTIPASKMLATGDPRAIRVVELAKAKRELADG